MRSPGEAVVVALAAFALTACGGGGGGRGGQAVAAPAELHQGNAPERKHEEGGRWEKLGERTVDGKNDKDTIAVGREDGKLKEILLKVEGSSLELHDVLVTFADGSTFSPPTRLTFGGGTTSRVIDLPGARRTVTKIELRYGNLPGGGRARMEVLGR
ncbi:MAG TPA: hypothetical protein VLT33_11770 [Labilithrix sp.]|nr:hypothetical protein [Labilithrix sp.]